MTERTRTSMQFRGQKRVDIEANAPELSSDAGALLLRAVEEDAGLLEDFASLIPDGRDPTRITHSRREQLLQRVFQIALGYEDQNDANALRVDPILKMACGGSPNGVDLSAQPTLSRLENAVDARAIKKMILRLEQRFIDDVADRDVVVLDVDPTDLRTHGNQQLSMFHGYYDHHCYLPLLVFDAQTGMLATAILRHGRAAAGRGFVHVVDRLVRGIKQRNPDCMIVVRGDGAYATPRVMRRLGWLEAELDDVFYLFGISKNAVLNRKLEPTLERAARLAAGWRTARLYAEFEYEAGSWWYPRRVVGKAEVTRHDNNPRYVVTNIEGFEPRHIYGAYCGRGRAELFIKEFKRALKAERMSCSSFWANFFRLILHALAYELMRRLRLKLHGLEDNPTLRKRAQELAKSQFDTIRLRLFKVAAVVTESVRRIRVQLAKSFPLKRIFFAALTLDG